MNLITIVVITVLACTCLYLLNKYLNENINYLGLRSDNIFLRDDLTSVTNKYNTTSKKLEDLKGQVRSSLCNLEESLAKLKKANVDKDSIELFEKALVELYRKTNY